MTSGLSQAAVASTVGMSDSKLGRIEAGRAHSLTLVDAVLLAGAVGLDLSCRLYPNGSRIRDGGQALKIQRLIDHVAAPIRVRLEWPLPSRSEAPPERRAWEALLQDSEGETGLEYEQRLYDLQAQTRRILLKWRDSGVARLLLVIAGTRGNRRVVDEYPSYLNHLPRLKTGTVLNLLESGRRPSASGWMFF